MSKIMEQNHYISALIFPPFNSCVSPSENRVWCQNYFFIQNFDGYVVIPMIAKKTVDLAPALVLATQLVMGVVFGIIGILLADPLLAMIKVALERRAEENEARAGSTEVSESGA